MRAAFAVAALLLAASPAAHAQLAIPPAPTARINDYAGVLSTDDKAKLEAQVAAQTQGRSYQIAVAIFPSLDGDAVEDASIRLAEKWKIGSKQNDDGVLITVFVKEHKMRIEVGYGLEDRLTDAKSARIVRDRMAPRFRDGDYYGGLRDAIGDIHTILTGQAPPVATSPQPPSTTATKGLPPGWIFFLAIAILVGLLRWRLFGFWGLFFGGGSSWTGGSGGWSSGSGGGGGFSGGGGSFGGGGASGSW